MTPALVIIVASVAIVWRVAGAWCRRDVDVEAMGFVEVQDMREKIGFDTRNVIAEAKDVLGWAADLTIIGIGRSEWNAEFVSKVDVAERTLEYFKVKQ